MQEAHERLRISLWVAIAVLVAGIPPIWPIGYYTLVRLVVCAYPDVERQLIGVMSREDRGAAAQAASEISDRPIWAVAATRQLQGLQGDGVFGRHR